VGSWQRANSLFCHTLQREADDFSRLHEIQGYALERVLDAVGKEKSLRTSLKGCEKLGTDPEPQCVNEARDVRVVVGLGNLNKFALDQ
jgi:hypothetical protein